MLLEQFVAATSERRSALRRWRKRPASRDQLCWGQYSRDLPDQLKVEAYRGQPIPVGPCPNRKMSDRKMRPLCSIGTGYLYRRGLIIAIVLALAAPENFGAYDALLRPASAARGCPQGKSCVASSSRQPTYEERHLSRRRWSYLWRRFQPSLRETKNLTAITFTGA